MKKSKMSKSFEINYLAEEACADELEIGNSKPNGKNNNNLIITAGK